MKDGINNQREPHLSGLGSWVDRYPEIALEAYGWDPRVFTISHEIKLTWKCSKNHLYKNLIHSRVYRNRVCQFCSGRKVLPGFNDLATKFPLIAAQACGWDPSKVVPGTGVVKLWQCDLGHQWKAQVSNRTSIKDRNKRGCPYCSGQKVLVGFNDLATKFPKLALEAYGWDPRTLTSGSGLKVDWICRNRHTWKTSVNNRTSNQSGCPVCLNRKLLSGFNDIVTKFPELVSQVYGWDPSQVLPGSGEKLPWICSRGHIRHISPYKKINYYPHTCPACKDANLDENAKALFYINNIYINDMGKDNLAGWKIGITRNLKQRNQAHNTHLDGYRTDTILTVEDTAINIRALETEMLRWLKGEVKVEPLLDRNSFLEGWSETVSVESVNFYYLSLQMLLIMYRIDFNKDECVRIAKSLDLDATTGRKLLEEIDKEIKTNRINRQTSNIAKVRQIV